MTFWTILVIFNLITSILSSSFVIYYSRTLTLHLVFSAFCHFGSLGVMSCLVIGWLWVRDVVGVYLFTHGVQILSFSHILSMYSELNKWHCGKQRRFEIKGGQNWYCPPKSAVLIPTGEAARIDTDRPVLIRAGPPVSINTGRAVSIRAEFSNRP